MCNCILTGHLVLCAWSGTLIRDTSCWCHSLTGVPCLRSGPRKGRARRGEHHRQPRRPAAPPGAQPAAPLPRRPLQTCVAFFSSVVAAVQLLCVATFFSSVVVVVVVVLLLLPLLLLRHFLLFGGGGAAVGNFCVKSCLSLASVAC